MTGAAATIAAESEGAEKRLSPRKDWVGRVIFEDERGEPLIYIHSENISVSGIYLASNIPMQVGSRAFLSFTLPTGAEIRTIGEVVRIKRDPRTSSRKDPARVGMGIRFLDLTTDQRQRITSFCES
jgi:hypothetical protein